MKKKEILKELMRAHYARVNMHCKIGSYYAGILVRKSGINETATPLQAFKYLSRFNKNMKVVIDGKEFTV